MNYKRSLQCKFGEKCCNYGKINVPLPPELPPYLESLFFGDSDEANYFRENIRAFNSLFTVASIKSKWRPKDDHGRGPYVYKCHGVVHRYIGSLKPKKGEASMGLQIYMHDSDDQIEYRCNMYDLENKEMAKSI